MSDTKTPVTKPSNTKRTFMFLIRHYIFTLSLIIIISVAGVFGYFYMFGSDSLNQARTVEQRLSSIETWRISSREDIDRQIRLQLPNITFNDEEFKALQAKVNQMQDTITQYTDASDIIQKNLPIWLVAYSQLVVVLQTSSPYQVPYQTLVATSKENSDILKTIAPLEKYAKTGIPTYISLEMDFQLLANEVIIDYRDKNSVGFSDRFFNLFSNMFLIRKTNFDNMSDSQSIDYIISKAEALMKAGDWYGAIKILDSAKITNVRMQNWIEQAKARQSVTDIMASIQNKIISLSVIGALK